MITITPENVQDCCRRLEELLGKDFVQGLHDKYEQLRRAPWPNWLKDSTYAKFHPFHRLWRELLMTRARAAETGELRLTAGGIALLALLSNLDSLQDCQNRERVITGLLENGRFYSAMFEAYVGAYYREAGHTVEFPPEDGNDGKQCDLIVGCRQGRVYVECKSLRDDRDSFACRSMIESFCRLLAKGRVSCRAHVELRACEIPAVQGSIADILNSLSKTGDFDSRPPDIPPWC